MADNRSGVLTTFKIRTADNRRGFSLATLTNQQDLQIHQVGLCRTSLIRSPVVFGKFDESLAREIFAAEPQLDGSDT
jgi:hypothetical protein